MLGRTDKIGYVSGTNIASRTGDRQPMKWRSDHPPHNKILSTFNFKVLVKGKNSVLLLIPIPSAAYPTAELFIHQHLI
jgi:hypothetical protein